MMKRTSFALFILSFLFAIPSYAQDGNAQNSLLPEIDPQDIEIRSEFRARFPGIRRQPILGFNPKPRVFRIDPNRTPFMESDRDAVASIALTRLDRPEPPQKSILENPSRTNAYIKAGFGNFITPDLQAYALRKLNEQSVASLNLDYSSSDGHLDNQDSGFRFLNLDGVYGTKLNSGSKFSIRAGAFSDMNHLFELPNVPGDNSGTAEKDYMGVSVGIILENNKNSFEGWEAYLNGLAVGIDLMAPNAALRGKQSEQLLHAGFEKTWAGADIYDVLSVNGDVKVGNYSVTNSEDTQWIYADATFGYSSLFNYETELELEGGLAYVNDGNNSKPLFIADAKLNHTMKEGFNLLGSIYTRAEMESIWNRHQTNRFLSTSSNTQYQYIFGVDGGLEYQLGSTTKLFTEISFQAISNYGFYGRSTQTFGANTERTFYELNYANASKFRLELGVAQQFISDKLWFDGTIYAQRPELKNGNDIPFEERVGANASFHAKPTDKISFNTWAQFAGERSAFDPNTEALSGFVLLNAGADYQINEKFGVYIKVLNILGEKYEIWDGYEERPFQVFGGIKLTL